MSNVLYFPNTTYRGQDLNRIRTLSDIDIKLNDGRVVQLLDQKHATISSAEGILEFVPTELEALLVSRVFQRELELVAFLDAAEKAEALIKLLEESAKQTPSTFAIGDRVLYVCRSKPLLEWPNHIIRQSIFEHATGRLMYRVENGALYPDSALQLVQRATAESLNELQIYLQSQDNAAPN